MEEATHADAGWDVVMQELCLVVLAFGRNNDTAKRPVTCLERGRYFGSDLIVLSISRRTYLKYFSKVFMHSQVKYTS